MAWTTPKTDFAPSDVVDESDFNAINENILSLHNRFDVSGSIIDNETVGIGGSYIQRRIKFGLPDGTQLVLKNARYRFGDNWPSASGLRLRVLYSVGAGDVLAWTSASSSGDEEPDQVIYANSSGSPVEYWYTIQAYNSSGSSSYDIQDTDGWCLTFEKESV
ncbi:MAG: hypothetical protein KC517_09285 [Bacteroidetes bacterium]|nr:hypothetical protein [Bacteroidota bacterium]